MTVTHGGMVELIELDMKEIDREIKISHVSELLAQYKETLVSTIITQFGLGPFLDSYREGGNVTTLQNANKNVFATEADREQFTEAFDRRNYEKDFPKKRKKRFQDSTELIDDFTGKSLFRDGTTHLDHVVSAKAIHSNDKARLYIDKDQRNEMATSEANLAWTNSSLNQSKNDKDLEQWMDLTNRKDSSQSNAEYYELNREAALAQNHVAKQHIKKTVGKAEAKYYTVNILSTGMAQGIRMGQKQALGLLLYELQAALASELIEYFRNFKTFGTLKRRIEEFKEVCFRVQSAVITKIKPIAKTFFDGFFSGFLANLITVLINTFATTTKNMARMLNDGAYALIRAVRMLIHPPSGMTRQQAILEASKILTTTVVTTLGVILTESFSAYIKSTPAAPFADVIAGVLGGILTSIVSVTLVYCIEHFVDILKKIGESISLIQYQLTVSAADIRKSFNKAMAEVEEEYQQILISVRQEYEELNQLTKLAYDLGSLAGVQFEASISLARVNGVQEKEILQSVHDIDDFFVN